MKDKVSLLIIVLAIISGPLRAQQDVTPGSDTVYVARGSVIEIGGKQYQPGSDTIFILPPGTNYRIRISAESQSDNFYDTLQIIASRKKWTRRLHNIVIRSPKTGPIIDTLRTSASIAPYLQYFGKTIRNVNVQKLVPFGPSIFDTTQQIISPVEQFGNKLHIQTKDKIISNYLLFKTGDRIDPSVIADNERIIRKLSFIEDARIYIQEVEGSSDSVDVLIVTKDAFSIGAVGELTDINSGRIEVFENNLAGLGHQIHAKFYWDDIKTPSVTPELFYIVNNIGGSFINSKIRYAKIFQDEIYQINFDRPFVTPNTKYAGAFNFERKSTEHNITYNDTLTIPTPIQYNQTDIWIGRSIRLSSKKVFTGRRINLIVATRVVNEHFFERPPDVSASTFYKYQHKTFWLSSISLSQQRFFTSNLIYSFGRTEDIPHGTLLNLTAGPEINEYENRFYAGASLSRGGLMGNLGYMYGRIEYGGFLKKDIAFHQGVFKADLNYFTNLYIIGRFKIRHFINMKYVYGIDRFDDEFVTINDRYGIRGFTDDHLQGTQKAIMRYEAVAFSPYFFFGFRFAFFGFADLGWISVNEPIFENPMYSGLGLGIRIKNERLVFETIQIRFGYYPIYHGNELPVSIDFSGEKKLNPNNFYVTKPSIARFE